MVKMVEVLLNDKYRLPITHSIPDLALYNAIKIYDYNLPSFEERSFGQPVFDGYGHLVKNMERPLQCQCKVPCQVTFNCQSSLHRGKRETPICFGGLDNKDRNGKMIERCDACWFRFYRGNKSRPLFPNKK